MTRTARTFGLLAACLAWAAAASAASAQDASWVVVGTGAPAPPETATVERVATALTARGQSVLALPFVTERVEREISAAPSPLSAELRSRLTAAAGSLLEPLAFARTAQVIDAARPLLAEADANAVAVGRDEVAVRAAGTLCLFVVRAQLQRHDAAAARAQAQACVRLVPDLVVDPSLHPPDVREVVARERAALESGAGAVLVVQGAPGDPEGCEIVLQGRSVGRTPWTRRALPAGEYGVQVACSPGTAARVHHVQLAERGVARVVVSARLDEALRTQPLVALSYSSAEHAGALGDHAAELGRAVGAARVVVVARDVNGAVSLRAGQVPASGGVTLGEAAPIARDDARSVARAVQSLLATAPSGGATAVSVPGQPAPRHADAGPSTGVRVAGWITTGTGTAGLVAGWLFWFSLQSHEDDLAIANPAAMGFVDLQKSVDDARLPILVSGLAGGGLATIGLPLLLPATDGVPWWSWIAGAAGAGLAGVGAFELATEGDCVGTTCTRREQTGILGAVLLAHAAPLIALPIVYLVRSATGDPAAHAMLRWSPSRAELTLGAAF